MGAGESLVEDSIPAASFLAGIDLGWYTVAVPTDFGYFVFDICAQQRR